MSGSALFLSPKAPPELFHLVTALYGGLGGRDEGASVVDGGRNGVPVGRFEVGSAES